MLKHHIAVHSLYEGQEVCIDDQAVWEEPLQDLVEDVQISVPFCGKLTFFPQEDGFLMQGSLKGQVGQTCYRCAEACYSDIDSEIVSFEPFPPTALAQVEDDEDEAFIDPDLDLSVFATIDNVLYFDIGMFLWEEFVMALPVKPLCSDACKGLCVACGMNLNTASCTCDTGVKDPRLAALHGLVVKKKTQKQ